MYYWTFFFCFVTFTKMRLCYTSWFVPSYSRWHITNIWVGKWCIYTRGQLALNREQGVRAVGSGTVLGEQTSTDPTWKVTVAQFQPVVLSVLWVMWLFFFLRKPEIRILMWNFLNFKFDNELRKFEPFYWSKKTVSELEMVKFLSCLMCMFPAEVGQGDTLLSSFT